jgi:hypothetical protein
MHHIQSLRSLLGAAIAATLLLASPAMAKPVDTDHRAAAPTSSLAGTVSPARHLGGTPTQDLRGEHARDAARAVTVAAPKQDLRGERALEAAYPSPKPVTPVAAAPVAKPLPAADTGGSRPDTWLLLLIGLAGCVLAAGGTAGVVRTRRTA